MELIALSYCGVMCFGIFLGYFLSRRQDDRTIIPTIERKTEEKLVDDEMYRCLHTPEELNEMREQRIETDGRK